MAHLRVWKALFCVAVADWAGDVVQRWSTNAQTAWLSHSVSRTVACAAGILLFAASATWADSEAVNPFGNSPEVVARGREIFNISCTACHGVDGGPSDRGPALGSVRAYARRTDAAIHDAVLNGIPGTGMPAIGLDATDSWRVVAYIRSLRAKAADFPVEGNVDAGKQLFSGKAACADCHTVYGRGGLLGPDLTDVAQRMSLRALRDALTRPKPHAPLGYQPAEILTKEGQTLRGVLKNRHNFSYQLLDRDGRLHLLNADEVARVDIREKSLMPADFDKRLTPKEFQDLLAYLTRLKR